MGARACGRRGLRGPLRQVRPRRTRGEGSPEPRAPRARSAWRPWRGRRAGRAEWLRGRRPVTGRRRPRAGRPVRAGAGADAGAEAAGRPGCGDPRCLAPGLRPPAPAGPPPARPAAGRQPQLVTELPQQRGRDGRLLLAPPAGSPRRVRGPERGSGLCSPRGVSDASSRWMDGALRLYAVPPTASLAPPAAFPTGKRRGVLRAPRVRPQFLETDFPQELPSQGGAGFHARNSLCSAASRDVAWGLALVPGEGTRPAQWGAVGRSGAGVSG